MPFVQRDTNGAITGAYANAQPGYADEFLSDDSPEVMAFRKPPVKPAMLSYVTMRLRFTDAERQAVLTARRASWQLDDFISLAQAEGEINLDSDLTSAAKVLLASSGLLTADRVAVVFAPL